MATIVKPPKPKLVKCEACEATIAYLPEEVEESNGTDYTLGFKRVKCPREKCPGYGYIERR